VKKRSIHGSIASELQPMATRNMERIDLSAAQVIRKDLRRPESVVAAAMRETLVSAQISAISHTNA
jgi:hypothetical protein